MSHRQKFIDTYGLRVVSAEPAAHPLPDVNRCDNAPLYNVTFRCEKTGKEIIIPMHQQEWSVKGSKDLTELFLLELLVLLDVRGRLHRAIEDYKNEGWPSDYWMTVMQEAGCSSGYSEWWDEDGKQWAYTREAAMAFLKYCDTIRDLAYDLLGEEGMDWLYYI